MVLDDGRVAGIGTHQQLMSTCETYREICLSQLSSERWAHDSKEILKRLFQYARPYAGYLIGGLLCAVAQHCPDSSWSGADW